MVRRGRTERWGRVGDVDRQVPAGAELMLAALLGIAGWWVILHAVFWLAG